MRYSERIPRKIPGWILGVILGEIMGNILTEVSRSIPRGVPAIFRGKSRARIPARISGWIPSGISEEILRKTSERITEKNSYKSEGILLKISKIIPGGILEGNRGGNRERTAAVIWGRISAEIPGWTAALEESHFEYPERFRFLRTIVITVTAHEPSLFGLTIFWWKPYLVMFQEFLNDRDSSSNSTRNLRWNPFQDFFFSNFHLTTIPPCHH